MDRIRNKYNPEASELKAQKCMDGLTKGECQSWLDHPCTKALKHNLEADLDRAVLTWVRGGFADRTVEGTALMQSRAIGITEAVEGVMTYIDDILENTQRESDPYEETLRTS